MRPLRSTPLGLSLLAAVIVGGAGASCASQGDELHAGPNDDGGADASSVITVPDAGLEACTDGRWCAVTPPVPAPVSFNGVWGTGPTDVWIVASPDIVIHWDGVEFKSTRLNTNQTIFGIWGSGATDVWAFSTGNVLWHYAGGDGGRGAWSAFDKDAGSDALWGGPVFAMWGRSSTDVWAVGPVVDTWVQPTVWHSDGWNGGVPNWVSTTTTPEPNPWGQEPSFNAVWGNDREVWVVGDKGRTRYCAGWKNGAATWTAVDSLTSLPLYALWGAGTGEVWAAGGVGTVRRFERQRDDTIVVQEVPFPNRATLRALSGFAADDIWAVGSDGTLAHWDGAAWSLVDLGASARRENELLAIWASGPQDVWVVGRDTLLHKGTTLLPGTTP